MEIMALDLGLRGATAGIFLMIVVVLLRIRPLNTAIRFAVALAAGAVAYVIATAPFVPKTSLWWTMPILAGNPVILCGSGRGRHSMTISWSGAGMAPCGWPSSPSGIHRP
jgi:hypothetical protein